MQKTEISFTLNGKPRTAETPPRMLLSDFLRHELSMTGTHVGCEHGVCGACTVLVDGASVRSCLTFAVQIDGAELTTVEGMADGGTLSAVQSAFWEEHGLQCGFCTPGMLAVAKELLDHNPNPTDDQILEAIAGNLCRCTGYTQIVAAVRSAALKLQAETETAVAAE
ncbi:(2Fe-2S)-binding protein [Thalassococcus sp. S3]|uniref:(2Fe-2S)-binding protein n=1 Tax=Thalassococcus sp. S3 TaxID=2017482 RepID=UPI0010243900|nr:(2Fe-2S)-binding protein [Thalassococcus sp. S3]QBF30806.1 (2Fe-2S)-binding protein [Thalassococcus sp. S3]